MNRPLETLQIRQDTKKKLQKYGIANVSELRSNKQSDLIKNCGLSNDELEELYETLDAPKAHLKFISLQKLLEDSSKCGHCIPTYFEALDDLLEGGLPFGKIIELCGQAGAGKTQLCMQLCVNIQLEQKFTGPKAVYIDTEGNFFTKRVIEIASKTIESINDKFNLNNNKSKLDVESIMSNILYVRCTDFIQLTAAINNLPNIISKYPTIKLVVLDSLASLFRFTDFKENEFMSMRSNILTNLQSNIFTLTTQNNLAFIITNQMTTKFIKSQDKSELTSVSCLVPALGEIWAHFPNIRILLTWNNNKRFASVCKSSFVQDKELEFQITGAGVRDLNSGMN